MNNFMREHLRKAEGVRERPYIDTVGKWTVGVGWNISDRGVPGYAAHELLSRGNITPETIDKLLEIALKEAEMIAERFLRAALLKQSINDTRRCAIIDMAYNLGEPRLFGFKKMRAAIEDGDWDRAADEALDSKWATQVGQRAHTVADWLRFGAML